MGCFCHHLYHYRLSNNTAAWRSGVTTSHYRWSYETVSCSPVEVIKRDCIEWTLPAPDFSKIEPVIYIGCADILQIFDENKRAESEGLRGPSSGSSVYSSSSSCLSFPLTSSIIRILPHVQLYLAMSSQLLPCSATCRLGSNTHVHLPETWLHKS